MISKTKSQCTCGRWIEPGHRDSDCCYLTQIGMKSPKIEKPRIVTWYALPEKKKQPMEDVHLINIIKRGKVVSHCKVKTIQVIQSEYNIWVNNEDLL